jgi:Tfp pilus assembly protein PilF
MMTVPSWRSKRFRLVGVLLILAISAGVGFWLLRDRVGLPKPGSARYEEYVIAFQVGTAALDANVPEPVETNLSRAIELIPQEPAAWANRGLFYLRHNSQFAKAAPDLARANRLAPDSPDILELLGHFAERQGKIDDAIAHFERASAGDLATPARLFSLFRLAEARGGPDADANRAKVLERLVALRPNSLPVLMERAMLSARRRVLDTLRDTFSRLEKLAQGWDQPAAKEMLASLRRDAGGKFDPIEYGERLQKLKNVLPKEAGYQSSSVELQPIPGEIGHSLQQFLVLAPIHLAPDGPDRELSFRDDTNASAFRPDVFQARWEQVLPVWLGQADRPVLFVASGKEVRRLDADHPRLTFPGGDKATPPSMDGVLAFDWNNDYRTDFLLAGAGGLRFYQQQQDGTFVDKGVNKFPLVDYYGAWAVDIDQDGDLDVVLAPRKGQVVLLRNDGKGTFTQVPIFPGVENVRGFAWLDLDNDGANDAVLLDADGKLHVFMNERSGQFRRRESPAPEDRYLAICAADVNDDGVFDLIAVRKDGVVLRHSDRDKGKGWDSAELARLAEPVEVNPGEARLSAVDLDNNGAVDLVFRTASFGAVWLADGTGAFEALATEVPGGLSEVFSFDEGGQYDFLNIDSKKQVRRHSTRPTKGYHWRVLRPRASPNGKGDQRVNSFTIGSEAEIRSGSLVVKQPVSRPVVTFGLGSRKATPVVRFVWTNGTFQNEFTLPQASVILVEQRLSGSCPVLFSWDGEKMVFVADFLWSAPLGMYINGQDKGGFMQTTDWVKVRADQLVPRDGYYDLRVNANLWETHFLDYLALMVVDHPPGSEMWVDERFFLTPTKPQVYLTEKPTPVHRALDHEGKDVTGIVTAIDGKYLDSFGRGDYQGITRDHWVEIDLGPDAPTTGPVYLLAHGFIQPTDSSINFALSQQDAIRPAPLRLEVPDGKGGWKVACPALGFPAGKNKTVVLRLDGIDGPGVSRRVRLRTNMEIYWDSLSYARGLDAGVCKKTTLLPTKADLSYRGLVRMSRAGPGTPELPHYDDVVPVAQGWRDLIGYHTRFGDVKELIEKVDDRYVIMNAGDEVRLRFPVPAPPPAGWKRDFVWIADGWEKDGNLNTRFSKTVLPLPFHGMTDYTKPPGRLEDDPAYRREDWQKYHTRYVTPTLFEKGLRTFRKTEFSHR